MIRITVFILAILFTASQAAATGGVYCDGADEDSVGAYLSVGRVPGFAVVNAHITALERTWDTGGQEGAEPIVMAQGAIVGDLIVADFTDPNVEGIVASLRVVQIHNDTGMAAAGVLSMPGIGIWPVTCVLD